MGTHSFKDANMPVEEELKPKNAGELHMIGLGLGDEQDVTIRGLKLIKNAHSVFLETYTSILGVSIQQLQNFYGRKLQMADRECVEERADQILDAACHPGGAAFLVVGDAFGATTHSDLWLRARERAITVNVVHNASIMNSVAVTGLQLYRFGETISLCFWTDTDRPTSYYDKLVANRKRGLHTLCLLDIKVKEPTLESLARGKKVYEQPRFMRVNQAIEQLLQIDTELQRNELDDESMVIGVARLGQRDERIVYGTAKKVAEVQFGDPLHCVIIPAEELHFHEKEVLKWFAL